MIRTWPPDNDDPNFRALVRARLEELGVEAARRLVRDAREKGVEGVKLPLGLQPSPEHVEGWIDEQDREREAQRDRRELRRHQVTWGIAIAAVIVSLASIILRR